MGRGGMLQNRKLGKTANGPKGAKVGGLGGGEERPSGSIRFPFRGMKPGMKHARREERGRGAEEASSKEGGERSGKAESRTRQVK